MKSLPSRLKELRNAKGCTQAEIAAYLQIDRSTYAKYEKDHSPSIETINKLAAFYSMTLDEFIESKPKSQYVVFSSNSGQEGVGELSDEEITLVKIFRSCDRKSDFIAKARVLALEMTLGPEFDDLKPE